MIYPTQRAVLLAASGAPVALLASAAVPSLWVLGLGWIMLVLLAMGLDVLRGAARNGVSVDALEPLFPAVGRPMAAQFVARFAKGKTPAAAEAALGCDDRLGLTQPRVASVPADDEARFTFDMIPNRRGAATLDTLWLRWRGPLGLVWKQQSFVLNEATPVRTDLQTVREEALRLFSKNALFGAKAERLAGQGTEFRALREFHAGMDRRAVDWKQSARHAMLLAKEYATERNHHIIMAIDAGRSMSEPLGNAPRLDRAINAALLLSYACLRAGDLAGLFAFDSRPRVSTGALSGAGAYAMLQQVAGRIEYSAEETNYTLGLGTLSGALKRRSLLVVFTEFTDSTSAELMVESLGRLGKRHLILFVVMRDAELEGLIAAEPVEPEDVARAVVAGTLLRERDAVVARLRRLGMLIVEAPADRLGPAVLNAYLDLKQRDLL